MFRFETFKTDDIFGKQKWKQILGLYIPLFAKLYYYAYESTSDLALHMCPIDNTIQNHYTIQNVTIPH